MDSWKLFDYAWALVGGLLMIVWNMLNGRIDHNFKNLSQRIDATDTEVDKQRDNIAKLFDKLDEHQRSDTENFSKVLEKMSEIHVDLIERLRR